MQTVVDRPDTRAPAPTGTGAARRFGRRIDPRIDPRIAWALALVVVAGGVLRFWGLGANRLNYDDAFTTMAGRLPIGDLFGYLRAHDSHPPLDYLLRAPLSRATNSEWWLRLPSVLCSIAAVALFAWWMRTRGWVGVLATALLAVSAFQVLHGREVRMYPELELIGVGAAVLADAWLRRARRWHAPAVGALVLVCLLTHVSGFLLGAGLLALAGRRTDREAWRWRGALALAAAGWAVIWGPSFVTQSQGGHSSWIPRTTLARAVHTVARLVTTRPQLHVVVVVVVAGAVFLWRTDRRLGRVWMCCVAIPIALAAVTGTVAPVLLDRTLTVSAWGPLLAIAFAVQAVARRSPVVAGVAVTLVAIVMIPASIHTVTVRTGPDVALRHLQGVVHAGDVVAIRPKVKQPELVWSVGVQAHRETGPTRVPGLRNSAAVVVDRDAPRSGRIWLLDWNRRAVLQHRFVRCAPTWTRGTSRVMCLQPVVAARAPASPRAPAAAVAAAAAQAVPDSFSF
jgi:hypothetical protein